MDYGGRGEVRVFHSVTSVRGLAALAVCWFHVGAWSELLPNGWMLTTAQYGWMGPHIFFIVSGFVVPWSLYVAHYRWRDAHRYLARRLMRLDPPYFITIIIVLALGYVGAMLGLPANEQPLDGTRLLSHLAYFSSIIGERWYNPVFWSLAIEFQFYLLIGLLLPGLAHRDPMIRRLTLSVCLALYAPFAFSIQHKWVMGYLPLFMLGFLLFQHYAGLVCRRELAGWALALSGIIAYSFTWVLALASIVVFMIVLFDGFRIQTTEFLGRISYSLYLIHLPVGIALVRISQPMIQNDSARILIALAILPVCILAAWLFYRAIEQPSIDLAKRISLKSGTEGRVELQLGSADRPKYLA